MRIAAFKKFGAIICSIYFSSVWTVTTWCISPSPWQSRRRTVGRWTRRDCPTSSSRIRKRCKRAGSNPVWPLTYTTNTQRFVRRLKKWCLLSLSLSHTHTHSLSHFISLFLLFSYSCLCARCVCAEGKIKMGAIVRETKPHSLSL
jgi:hypothetical protein